MSATGNQVKRQKRLLLFPSTHLFGSKVKDAHAVKPSRCCFERRVLQGRCEEGEGGFIVTPTSLLAVLLLARLNVSKLLGTLDVPWGGLYVVPSLLLLRVRDLCNGMCRCKCQWGNATSV